MRLSKFHELTQSILLFVAVPCWSLLSNDIQPGESRFAADQRVEYVVGNAPLIIAAPHGGRLKPESIPDRTYGTLLNDAHTDLLAQDIAEAFHEKTGRHAHVVICHLKRIKVDCNRDIEEGAQGNPEAEAVWRAFHAFAEEAQQSVEDTHDQGLFLDIHGHGRPENWIMLGYLMTKSDLKLDDSELSRLSEESSIQALTDDLPFIELLRGPTSLGAFLQENGYAAVPSPQNPHPGEASFLSGGYNTRRYGSLNGGTFSAIQIECPRPGIRDTSDNRKAFGDALAESALEFLQIHYRIEF